MLNEITELPVTSEVIDNNEPIKDFEPSFLLQNKQNMYASLASKIVENAHEIKNEAVRESITGAGAIEHRYEFVATIAGITFINDSKATNVHATWYALHRMSTSIVLILGGVDKNNDYELLKPLIKQKVVAIVCLGKDNRKIHEAFDDGLMIIVNTDSARDAASVAFHLAKKGDTILLSPACASFDLFKNYEDRGTQFKQAVKDL